MEREEMKVHGARGRRAEADRLLRAYRRSEEILRATRKFSGGNYYGEDTACEAALSARMFSLRSAILGMSDERERMVLYFYYVKGFTLERCAKMMGVSLRTVVRIKSAALEKIAEKLQK